MSPFLRQSKFTIPGFLGAFFFCLGSAVADGTLDQQALDDVAINTPRSITQAQSTGHPLVPGQEVPDGFGTSKIWSSAGPLQGNPLPIAPHAPIAPQAPAPMAAPSAIPQIGSIGVIIDERTR